MSEVTTIGLDLAKNVFQVHGADDSCRAVIRQKLRRDQALSFFSQVPPCVVAMEACGGVGPVRLAAPDIRFDVRRRHQANIMAEPAKGASPVMGPGTGFHADEAGWHVLEEREHLAAPQLTPENDRALGIDAVKLEDRFGEIDADRDMLFQLTGAARPDEPLPWQHPASAS